MSSRGSLRVQLSLLFDDETLFDGFIIPMKENKELNSCIIKLLSSYFYNDEVRALVDNCTAEEMQSESEQDANMFNMFANARQMLACMSAMEDIVLDDLDNGISSMTSKMNDMAEMSGGARSTETDYGVSTPQINTQFSIEDKRFKDNDKTANHTKEDMSDSYINERLELQDRRLASIEDTLNNIARQLNVKVESVKDVQKSVSENDSSQVQKVYDSHDLNLINTESKEDVKPIEIKHDSIESNTIEENKSVVEEEVQEPIDGSSVLQEFINNADDIFG